MINTERSLLSKRCAIIDYGMGNLHSAHGALAAVAPNTEVIISSRAEEILAADHVVLPGVGAIRDCVAEIRQQGMDEVVAEVAKSKPLLGICVGLQALMTHSEENKGIDGLDFFSGQVKFFGQDLNAQGERLKVPHMGWNQVQQVQTHPLWHDISDNSRFYFVHSYHVQAEDAAQVYGRGSYGLDFDAALGCENVFAVQFHPEKSHLNGLQLLQNFLAWDGQV